MSIPNITYSPSAHYSAQHAASSAAPLCTGAKLPTIGSGNLTALVLTAAGVGNTGAL